MKIKSIISIIWLLFVNYSALWGQYPPYQRLMTVEGKNVDNNIYTSLRFNHGILDGKIVYLTNKGEIEFVSPYDNLVRIKVSTKSNVYHYYLYQNGWRILNSQLKPITDFEYDEIKSIHDNVLAVREGEFWGAIDTLGTQLLPFDYDYIEDFKGDFVTLRNKKKQVFCLINKYGKVLIDNGVNGSNLIREDIPNLIAVETDKWGVIDINGKEILPFDYDNIYEANFDEPFSVITRLGQSGLINKNGKLLIDAEYDKIDVFPEGAIATYNTDSLLYSFFNTKGELKLTSKNKITNTKKNNLKIDDDNCYTSYYNYKGELIETIYNNNYNMSNPGPFYDCKTGFYGYSDGSKLIIPCVYDYITRLDDFHFKVMKNNKQGIVNIQNKTVLPIKYKYFTEVAPNRCIVSTFDDKEILFDWDGKQLVPSKYYTLRPTPFDSTLFIAYNYDKQVWGMRDINGKQVLPDVYNEKRSFHRDYLGNGYYFVFRNSLYRILNGKTFEEEVLFNYMESFRISVDIVGYRVKDKIGAYVATPQGLKKIPAEYEEIKLLDNKSITANKNGKWGLIDVNNNVKIPFEYDCIRDFYDDIVVVVKN